MCEATKPPEEENNYNENNTEEAENSDEDYSDEDDVDEMTSEEMKALDSKLDALNLVLDQMECKRDQIHEQLIELLKSSRNIRKEFQAESLMELTDGASQE